MYPLDWQYPHIKHFTFFIINSTSGYFGDIDPHFGDIDPPLRF